MGKLTFDDYLNEMTVAKKGNMPVSKSERKSIFNDMKIEGLEAEWKLLGSIQKFEVYISKSTDIMDRHTYIIGKQDGEYFQIMGQIKLTREEQFEKKSNIDKIYKLPVHNIDSVIVDNTFRRRGIATAFYSFLLAKMKYILMGDEEQYDGARRLWADLSKQSSLKLSIYDYNTGDKLKDDYEIKLDDEFFDPELYSWDKSKAHVRPILTIKK